MSEKFITMYFDDQGGVEVSTQGFVGKACEHESQQLLATIGGQMVEEKKKPEYYEDGDDPVRILNQ